MWQRCNKALLWLATVWPLLLISAALWYTGYQGRVEQAEQANHAAHQTVFSARQNCRRGERDRYGNMEAWYGAYKTRLRAANGAPPALRTSDLNAAADYLATVKTDMSHESAGESLTWPRDGRTRPLGVGSFSCEAANPYPTSVRAALFVFA